MDEMNPYYADIPTIQFKDNIEQKSKDKITDTLTQFDDIYIPDNTRFYLNNVVYQLTPIVKQHQLLEIVKILCQTFNCIECTKTLRRGDHRKHNEFLIQEFVKTKTIEACSPNTISYYRSTVRKFLEYVNKHVEDVETQDIEAWFQDNMDKPEPWSPTTRDNNRRILNTFYEWTQSRKYTIYNPVKAIKPTKNKRYRVKKPFTKQDIIKLQDNCTNLRDRAIIELLLSSGIRVAELQSLDITDIDFNNYEFLVVGKGDKQRYAYFNEETKYYLQKYIDSRTDNNPALFVSINSPYDRLGVTGIETMVRNLGADAGVTGRAHPHRFRHTFATMALDKGIPIEQVQKLLGHEQLDTTLIYAKVAREDVKHNHKKLMN